MAGIKASELAPEEKKRHRSPNYPTVSLREAVERLDRFFKRDGKAGAPSELAAVHIGFSKPHGQAMSVLAALKKFGLVAESNGRIVPTQAGIEIVNLRADDPRRVAALRTAVQAPATYRELIEQHKDTGWPDNDVLERELVTYKNFNPNAVSGFVKDFKDSLEFAGLSDVNALELPMEEHHEPMLRDDPFKMQAGLEKPPGAGKPFRATETSHISTPVGKDDDGNPVFAQVRIDGALKREFITGLKKYLEYLETTLQ